MQEQRHELVQRERVHQGEGDLQGDSAPLQALERTLDKGIMVKRSAILRLLGIDLLTFEEHRYAASFETHLQGAEAMEQPAPLPPPHPAGPAGVVEMDDAEQSQQS